MKNIDDLLSEVKGNSDWKSNYAIARGLGYTHDSQVNAWKRRAAMPSIEDIIAMADHAKLDLGEAVRAVAYSKMNERPLKQTGFADVKTMMGLSALSLVAVTGTPYAIQLALSVGAVHCILC